MTRLLKPLFIFIFLIPSLNSIGQQLTVFNVTCLELVQNVAIFNLGQTKSVLTNENGVADISGFEAPDPLIFLHTAYFTLIIDVPELMEMDYRVGLAARTIQLDQIIISASKWEQNRKEILNKIVIIPDTEIAFENPQTSADLVGIFNEVFVQKS